MGYSHYYRRAKNLDPVAFSAAVSDFKKLISPLRSAGIRLGNYLGENKPILTKKEIGFNGLVQCGHAKRDLSLPWPSSTAAGVKPNAVAVKAGSWYAGDLLETRVCDGDCSYETFVVERDLTPEDYQKPDVHDLYWSFCKTGYRPYDVAVTAALIILKKHLGDDIRISSDGEDKDWEDARKLVQHVLGYGAEYHIPAIDPGNRFELVSKNA